MDDIDRMEDIEMTERDAVFFFFFLEQLCCWCKEQRENIPPANWPVVVMDLLFLTVAVFDYANKVLPLENFQSNAELGKQRRRCTFNTDTV